VNPVNLFVSTHHCMFVARYRSRQWVNINSDSWPTDLLK